MMRLFCNIFQVTNLLVQRHVTEARLIGFVYTKVSVMGHCETFFLHQFVFRKAFNADGVDRCNLHRLFSVSAAP